MAERTDDRLAVFLYVLARDHLTFGKVNEIVQGINLEIGPFDLTDEDAARWAKRLSDEIVGESD